MQEITMQDTDAIGGGGFLSWFAIQLGVRTAEYIAGQVAAGNIDYASIAETQGTYYNTVGS